MLYHNGGVTKKRKGGPKVGEEMMPPKEKQLTTGPTGSRGQKGQSTGSEGSGRDQETMMLKMRTWGGYSTGWVSIEQKAACHRRGQRV